MNINKDHWIYKKDGPLGLKGEKLKQTTVNEMKNRDVICMDICCIIYSDGLSFCKHSEGLIPSSYRKTESFSWQS